MRRVLPITLALTACWTDPNWQDTQDGLDDYEILDASIPGGADASTTDGGQGSDAGPPDAARPADAGVLPGSDSDADGLDDAFELAAGAPSLLNPMASDTDGDGTSDAQEDPDGDGLTNLEEQRAGTVASIPAGTRPSPVRLDVLVELDCMADRCLNDAVIAMAAEAYDALPNEGAAGNVGVGLHVYRDEMAISAQEFDGSFAQRHDFLAAHGPMGASLQGTFPRNKLVHVVVAAQRTDISGRGGELVTEANGAVEKAGVFVYRDALAALHPACGVPSDPTRPAITLEEALAGTLVHELGHALQLGHDTEVGGGVNAFNVMSVPDGCGEAQQRFHGTGNSDGSLGATQSEQASRFSNAAAQLMEFGNKVSVDTARLDVDTGHEM